MVPGSSSTMQREQGFEDTLAKEFPDIHIADAQYCMSDRARALAITENMLTAHPDLDALFASAEPGTVGAAKAVESRGLADKVHFVGFDFSNTIEDGLKGGAIDALVVQDPFKIGYMAVQAVLEKLEGGSPGKAHRNAHPCRDARRPRPPGDRRAVASRLRPLFEVERRAKVSERPAYLM